MEVKAQSQAETEATAGVLLGKQILGAKTEKEQTALLQRVSKLEDKAKAKLAAWIGSQLKDPNVKRLVPALRSLGSHSATATLGKLAATGTDGSFNASAGGAALKTLLLLPAQRSVPILITNSRATDGDVASANMHALARLLTEGSEEGGTDAAASQKAFGNQARKIEERLVANAEDKSPAALAALAQFRKAMSFVVSQTVVKTNDLKLVLREFVEGSGDSLRLGVLDGIPQRLKVRGRSFQVLRSVERSRRAQLSPEERDALESMDEFVENKIRKSKRLRLLQRKIEDEREALSSAVATICGETEDTDTLLRGLGMIRTFTDQLDEDWAPLLIELLNHPDARLKLLSFQTLKRLSKQKLPQSHLRWSEWWKKKQAEPESEEGEDE
jgi:hypothetical protein